MDDQPGNIGQLYTLAEAASLTGMSVDALRHRVKRRKLQSVRGNDGMTRVRLDDAAIQASRASQAGDDAASVLGATSRFAQNCTVRPMHEQLTFRPGSERGFCNGSRQIWRRSDNPSAYLRL